MADAAVAASRGSGRSSDVGLQRIGRGKLAEARLPAEVWSGGARSRRLQRWSLGRRAAGASDRRIYAGGSWTTGEVAVTSDTAGSR